jgi:predicted lysophospholipase L1 biosynthesis ABC-type transport system permease subunit
MFQRQWRTIVGVVADVHLQKLSRNVEPTIYTPAAQRGSGSLQILLRYAGSSRNLEGAIRRAVSDVEARATVTGVDTMADLIRRSAGDERYRALLTSLFGVLAVCLASIGMYGVTARAVARRTREVGIRLALGATGGRVIRLLVSHTLVGVIIGLLIGMVGAGIATRFLAPFLFGVTATDPATYLGIAGLLVGASVLASWLPARRAGRLPVAGVLRGE